jgi:uncharacterized protein (DUF2461 family)
MLRRRLRVWRYKRELRAFDKATAHVTDELVLDAMNERVYAVWNKTTANLLAEFDTREEAEAFLVELGSHDDDVIVEEDLGT